MYVWPKYQKKSVYLTLIIQIRSLLKFDLFHNYLILKLKKKNNLTNKIGKDIISLQKKLI